MIRGSKFRQQFLKGTLWEQARMCPLDPDASARQYFRLCGSIKPAILMDAPPARESVADFVTIANHLRKLNLSAPEVYCSDNENGFAVLEDFGDETFTQLLSQGFNESELYRLATDCLLAIQNHPTAIQIELSRRESTFLSEVHLLCDWFYPLLTGHACTDAVRDTFAQAWMECLSNIEHGKDVLVLRDFHVDNAMLLSKRDGPRRCGLLDFQDAAIGPAAYDLISLLEDARRDVGSSVYNECFSHYLAHSRVVGDHRSFQRNCTILAAQRHTRVAGVFARLHMRDGKSHYLAHLPRVTRYLRKHLQSSYLARLSHWFDRYLPSFDDSVLLRTICSN